MSETTYCNPGCDPEFNGRPSSICKTLCGRFPDLIPEQPTPNEIRNLTPLDQFAIGTLSVAEKQIQSLSMQTIRALLDIRQDRLITRTEAARAIVQTAYVIADEMLIESMKRNSNER